MTEVRQGLVRRLLDMLPCDCVKLGEMCPICNKVYTQVMGNLELRGLIFNKNKPNDIKEK